MNATRHWTRQHELIHWLLVIATAIALTLLVARVLGSAEPMPEPKLLPGDLIVMAKPLAPEATPFFPESPPARVLPPAEAAARLQGIIEYHRSGEALKAIQEWAEVRLPAENAHWREIAIGAAYLRLGELERATLHLEIAQQLCPGHPLAAYFTGLLRLEQAEASGRVPEGRHPVDLLVSYTPREDQAMYRLLAMGELERAIGHSEEARLEEPLFGFDPTVEQGLIVPTAGDLVTALGAGNFAGKAHHVLFGLRLDQGELALAEQHLHLAVRSGLAALHGYRDLAEAYLVAGQNREALRMGVKDFQTNSPELARFFAWVMQSCQPAEGWMW